MTATAMIDSTTGAGATIPTNAHHAVGVPSSFVRRSQKVASLNVRERASGTREVEAVPAPSLDRLGRRLSSIVALSAVVPFRWKARDTALNRTASRVARLRIGGVRALLVWAGPPFAGAKGTTGARLCVRALLVWAGPPFAGAKGTTGARLCASRGVGSSRCIRCCLLRRVSVVHSWPKRRSDDWLNHAERWRPAGKQHLQMRLFRDVHRRASPYPTRPVTPEVAGSSPVAPVL